MLQKVCQNKNSLQEYLKYDPLDLGILEKIWIIH